MNNYFFLINRLLICSLALLLFSCGGKTDKTIADRQQDFAPLSCIVLLPTEIPRGELAADPGRGQDLHAGASFFDRTLKRMLDQSKVEKIIDPVELTQQFSEISGGTAGVLKVIGERTQCNTIMVVNLSKFKQRQGGEFAIDDAASTAFELRLVAADTGSTLWNATFNETQTSLFSNLFDFGKARSRGFKWITVEELAAQGIEEKLAGCPYLY